MVCLQIGALFAYKVNQVMNKKKLSDSIMKYRMANDRVSPQKLMRLKNAYRHPWLDERDSIFDYYNERLKSDGMQRRVMDLNVKDKPDFKSLSNL